MSAFNARENRKAFYQQSIEEVLAALKADAGRGLQETEAQLAKYGRNELVTEKPVPGWTGFFAPWWAVPCCGSGNCPNC